MTICIGIMQIIRKATQLPNVGKSQRETNPSETAITKIAAAIPNTGCLNPSTLPPLVAIRYFARGMIPHRMECRLRGLKQKDRRRFVRGLVVSDSRETYCWLLAVPVVP